jgi:hypothetical protein
METKKWKWMLTAFLCSATLGALGIGTHLMTQAPSAPAAAKAQAVKSTLQKKADATGTTYEYVFDLTHPASTNYATTVCNVDVDVLCKIFGVADESALQTAMTDKTILFYAVQGTTGALNATITANGYGQWFDKNGDVCTWGSGNAVFFSEYNSSYFNIGDYPSKVANGETYTIRQAMVKGNIRVNFTFNITVGDVEKVTTTTQPDVKVDTKTDSIPAEEAWIIHPYVQCNEQPRLEQNYIQVMEGENVTLSATSAVDSVSTIRCLWYKYVPYKSNQRVGSSSSCQLKNVTVDNAGTYMLTTKVGKVTRNYYFFVDVQTEKAGTQYLWKDHTPHFSYNFKSEYPNLQEPQNVLNDASGVAGRKSDRWWTCVWGKNRRSLVTDTAIVLMLKRFNKDFAYIRDEMGWPPDKRAKRGYKSGIYVYGSGLNTDNADSTATGGWQGSIYYAGENWPMVFISYYPIYCFDPKCPYGDKESQCSAMIHEGIHSVLADMPGCKEAAWFQEGGNTWLQSAMETKRSGTYGTPGFLDGAPFLAPFMPVECYSGWLNDGSFGGPSAEGVNMFNGSQQICTWRNYLGGVQYGNGFPIFLGEAVGDGAVPWIWRYCPGRVLEGIGDSIGDKAMRLLLLQYRARQATYDLGGWSKPYRSVADANFGITLKAEWKPYNKMPKTAKLTPYAALSKPDSLGWLHPDTLTNPGWSGANVIPLHVTGDTCSIEFLPKGPGMLCQLCYKTKAGKCYYSQPVQCGTVTLTMPEPPANGVVFAIAANTDWIFENDETRKKHHNYSIRFVHNVLGVGQPNLRWYLNESTISDPVFTGIKTVETPTSTSSKPSVQLVSGRLRPGADLSLILHNVKAKDVRVRMFGLSGIAVQNGTLGADGSFQLPTAIAKGLYFLEFTHKGLKDAYKIIVE